MASVIRGSDNFDSLIAKFDAGKSFSTNGYQKLSNGLIIQWGRHYHTAGANGQSTVTFPTSFPTSCLNVSVASNTGGGGIYDANIGTFSVSNFTFKHYYNNTYVMWFAIGY